MQLQVYPSNARKRKGQVFLRELHALQDGEAQANLAMRLSTDTRYKPNRGHSHLLPAILHLPNAFSKWCRHSPPKTPRNNHQPTISTRITTLYTRSRTLHSILNTLTRNIPSTRRPFQHDRLASPHLTSPHHKSSPTMIQSFFPTQHKTTPNQWTMP